MKTIFSKGIAIRAIVLLLLILNFHVSAQPRWRPMGPDESNQAALDQVSTVNMALDLKGIPYIAYKDRYQGTSFPSTIDVRKFINGSWENVGNPFLYSGDLSNIILSPTGIPYIGLFGIDYLPVLKFNGTGWDTLGSSSAYKGFVRSNQSLAFDANGNLFMAFLDSSYDVAVMKYNGVSWNYVGAPQGETSNCSNAQIAVDPSGVPYIVYNKDTAGALPIVKKYNGIAWVQVGSLGNGGGTYRGASIKIDSTGTPYIYYTGAAPGYGLHVLSFNGSSWINVGGQSPSTGGNSLFKSTMDLDKNGLPYIVFQTANITSLVRYDGHNWVSLCTIPNLDTSLYGYEYPGYLGLDSLDIPYVYVTNFYNIKVLKYYNNEWIHLGEHPPLNKSGPVVSNNSEFPYVVSVDYDSSISRISVNRYNGNSWASIKTFNGSVYVSYSSMPACVLDSVGNPFVEYADSLTNHVKHYTGSAWVDVGPSVFLPGFNIDMKLDKADKPYLAYIDAIENRKLKVKTFNGIDWVSVDTVGFNFNHVYDYSFYFDKRNNLFVCYLDSPSYIYKVLKYENGSWHYLGGPTDMGIQCQLILDSQDTPFLLYHSQTYHYQPVLLKYSGNAWIPVGNAPLADHAMQSRFVLDHAGKPFVIFSDTSSSVNYNTSTVKTFDGSNWINVGQPNFTAGKTNWPSIAITPSGVLYTLSRSNGGEGNGSWGYKYNVLADSVVWPGDADANNVVDNLDLLPIGLAYGATGAARVTQSIVWSAWPSIDWADTFTNYIAHVNFKNADCNGNGIINADDTLAIMQNFSLTHSKTGDRGNPWRSGIPSLIPVLSRDTLRSSDTFSVSFVLGSSGSPVNNLYGLAFTYNFDPMLVDPSFTTSSVANSWIDSGSDKLSIARVVNSDGKIKIGLTRINHTSCNGFGPIASSQFKMVDQSRNNYNNFSNIGYISDLVAIDESGVLIPLNTGADTSHVFIINTGINNIDNESIRMWPNPTKGKVQISSPIQMTEITITNSIGQNVLVLSEQSAKVINVDLSNVPSGIYLAYIKTVNGTGIMKLVIEK